ncbi:MAG TPA: ribonucleoside-diphosphate reductase subunit alpha, partial [Halomonas sp.]|nr:ribonucleoside-diphosphate reductase subunit alpha [Halomonas sp.]
MRITTSSDSASVTVTARLLLDSLRREALAFLEIAEQATFHAMADLYKPAFQAYVARGIEFKQLDPRLAEFDLERLGEALDHTRDAQFTCLSLQALYERCLIHRDEVRYELPQVMFMRVAMGLALNEDDREARAIEFYELLSRFDYMASTPTLLNAGTLRSQLSSSYLTSVPDDLDGIYSAIRDSAQLSKRAGGLGNDWTPVRALGSWIKGASGKSQGVVPFLKVLNDTAAGVKQDGKRQAAVCAYLETWHLDIEEFLELRKNASDDRRRTHGMHTASWVPDLFMKRVFDDGDWTLFSPSDCPDLHELYGAAFDGRYREYEAMTENGRITLFKRLKARDLWRKMLSMLSETGHPWITFKDPCNLRSPQQHAGVVHSSSLRTEITLNTSIDEIAVCNQGSVNLASHMVDGRLDGAKLKKTVRTAVRMLDNVIDINRCAVPQARNSSLRHRPVGPEGTVGITLGQLPEPAVQHQRLQYEQHEREHHPHQGHGVHPPITQLQVASPGVQGIQHVEARQTGDQRADARLGGETVFDALEDVDPIGGRDESAYRRQQHGGDHGDAADPEDHAQNVQGAGEGVLVHKRNSGVESGECKRKCAWLWTRRPFTRPPKSLQQIEGLVRRPPKATVGGQKFAAFNIEDV